jgi:hypothetical protein
MILAVAPGDCLDHDRAAFRALHSAHGVFQIDVEAPGRHILEQAFRQSVVSGSLRATPAANGTSIPPRFHFYQEGLAVFRKDRLLKAEGFEIMALVKYSYYAHGNVPLGMCCKICLGNKTLHHAHYAVKCHVS